MRDSCVVPIGWSARVKVVSNRVFLCTLGAISVLIISDPVIDTVLVISQVSFTSSGLAPFEVFIQMSIVKR